MDIFRKCYDFKDAEKARQTGLYPYFIPIESAEENEVIIDGKKYVMLGSNNYLGLTTHPKVKEAAIKAIEKYGTSACGSRFLNGTLVLHKRLERKLAEFLNKDDAIVFSTGYQTNLGTISALVGKGDYVILDKWDHASIVDGTKLSNGKVIRFLHNNMEDLEKKLRELPEDAGKLIVVDGVFSMEGDIVNLPEVVKLARKYGARVMVDDAHSIGILGKGGRGTAEHFDMLDEVDIIMCTFSKSFASLGGFIVGDKEVIDYIRHFARSLIFSASMTPSSVAAAEASLEIIKNEPERREKLWKNARKMQEGLKKAIDKVNFNSGPVWEIFAIPIYHGSY